MIVVDTNVIAYLFLEGEKTERAERLLRTDPEWAVPLLWRSELQNVLAHYMRRGILSVEDCLQVMQSAGEIVRGREFTVPPARVFESVSRSSCSAYDCEFVALAEDLNVPLVTADSQVLADFPVVAISLEIFVDK